MSAVATTTGKDDVILEELMYHETPRPVFVSAIEDRDGPGCFYCGKELGPGEKTVDHIVSRREGKRRGWEESSIHAIGNCVIACRPCNALKGDRPLNEDGTIPPRPMSRKARKLQRAQRPEVCTTCRSGRKLKVDETCPVCYSGPQPVKYPTYYKRSPKVCGHGWDNPLEHCWGCLVAWPWLRKGSKDELSFPR